MIDTKPTAERDNKIQGEILNVVGDEKLWRKRSYWPKEFIKRPIVTSSDSDDEERSNVGQMPPSDEEE